jgi:hypothetical protein
MRKHNRSIHKIPRIISDDDDAYCAYSETAASVLIFAIHPALICQLQLKKLLTELEVE